MKNKIWIAIILAGIFAVSFSLAYAATAATKSTEMKKGNKGNFPRGITVSFKADAVPAPEKQSKPKLFDETERSERQRGTDVAVKAQDEIAPPLPPSNQ